jgi:NADH dehydrogenase
MSDDAVPYDFLILAPGASHSYFGHDEWAPLAPGLKWIDDALEIRRRILMAYELAERESDPDVRRALLTFVVVGAGPTGVELAGAMAEIARQTLRHDFRDIDPAQSRIVLLEGGGRVLPTFPEDLSRRAEEQLRHLGVEVRSGALVTGITPHHVRIGTAGESISTRTALWAAGVQASPIMRSLGQTLDRSGRVAVDPDLSLPGYPEVFVVGDVALFTHQGGRPLPGVAPVAIQQGQASAENVWRTINALPRRPFRYRNPGNIATIGRAAAVAELGWLHFSGLPAWLAWLLVHIYWLIGFDNRLLVLFRWAWSYFTYQRGARLITGPVEQPVKPLEDESSPGAGGPSAAP